MDTQLTARVVTSREVDWLLGRSYPVLIQRLATAFKKKAAGAAVSVPRRRTRVDEGRSYQELAGAWGGIVGSKLYVSGPAIDGVTGVVVLFDAQIGRLRAVIDATSLSPWRTGAVTGVATRWLASEGARKLGVVGAGHQALSQVKGVLAVRAVEEVAVFNRTRRRASEFCSAHEKEIDATMRPVDSLVEAVAGAEVIVTATSSDTPVLGPAERGWLGDSAHINAIGANRPQKWELHPGLMGEAAVIAVDDLAQAQVEATDIIAAVQAGAIDWGSVIELGAAATESSLRDRGLSIFESQGIGLADVVTAELVGELAESENVGLIVDV